MEQGLAVDDLTGWHRDETEQRHHGHALAGAAFAHYPEELAFVKVEADPVDRVNDTVLGVELSYQIADFEYFFRLAHVSRVLLEVDGRLNRWGLGSGPQREPQLLRPVYGS